METLTPPVPATPVRRRHRIKSAESGSSGRRTGRIVGIIAIVLLVYGGTLFAYWYFSASATELGPPDLGNGSETVVLVTAQTLRTTDYKLDVKVLVVPQDDLLDERLDVLKEDMSVRLFPWSSSGDLTFPAGESPKEVSAVLDVNGDVNNWPFDSYSTEPLSATVLVGSGDDREIRPTRVAVEGSLQGWDISESEVARSAQAPGDGDAVQITLKRAPGPLAFNLGICLVLITLPSLAIFTALQVITRRKEFQMPFVTWYAAMLFAVVPLRNILPGAPPPGAWIDVALVLWVLVALVAAMVIYINAWYRQVD